MRQQYSRHSNHRKRRRFSRLRGLFRERQIYLRSEGEVQFVTLKPWFQVLSIFVIMGSLFWLAFATINITFKDQLLALKERRMYQTRLEYEDRMASMRLRVDKLNTKLMIDQEQYLKKVDEVRAEYERLVERQKQLSTFLRGEWGASTVPAEQPSQGNAAGNSDGTITNSTTPANDNDKESLNSLSITKFTAHRFATEGALLIPLDAVRQQFNRLEDLHVSILDDYISVTKKRVEKAREILESFGVNGMKLAENSKFKPQDAIGGPFISLSAEEVGSERIAARISQAVAHLSTVEKIRHEANRLPLSLPMKKVQRISSGFGLRQDPFRRTAAMHRGVDFKGPFGSLIRATAPGEVLKAGWEGAYGRLVEIRHYNGITTRYAHMSKVLVNVGDHVKKGTPVGKLGSTGRSTGPHLHYETRIRGRAVNPVKFWKARNALQKLSKR